MALLGAPGQELAGRLVLQECLKHRPTGETWKAVDHDGTPMVVKLVGPGPVSSAVRLRLEHEAKVLSELDLKGRPLAVGMYEQGMYLVQPYIEGRDLEARIRQGALPVESTVGIGIDVLAALAQAHERNIVHRDVKPANIVIDPTGPQDRAALIDFGLARSAWLSPTLRDEPVGTARYLAPEAAGLVDADVDERSDLYSVGVVLYECLTGTPPFLGATVGEVLRAHATEEPAPLRVRRHEVPGALDAIVHRLLAKDPGERYQSATAAMSDLQALLAGLQIGVADPPVTIGQSDRRRSLTEASYIGRSAEVKALAELLDGPESPAGVVLVEADSGGGKSRLLDEVCLRLDPSVLVLRGHGLDRVALHPFQILDGVAAGLSERCRDDPAFGATLRQNLGDWADAVAGATPALAEALGAAGAAGGPEAYGEARTVSALCALLDALGAAGRPVAVVLDDAQWADALTVKLLAEWPRPGRLPIGCRLTVVAAFRSEEVPEHHPLRAVPVSGHIRLAPMTDQEVAALCESMAGPLPAEATAAVVRLAEGSPFMASAVIRGMVETGVLEHSGGGWILDPDALDRAQTSRRAGIFLSRRIGSLSERTGRFLSAGAVLGKEFDLDAALDLAGLDGDRAGEAFQEARQRRLIWVDERKGRCVFTHDKLRETLLEQLAPSDRQALHLRVADGLSRQTPAPAFELAYHYDAAGLPRAAFPFAMTAAATARSRHALDVALAQYRIAERGADGATTPDERRLLHEGLGEVLSLAGEYGRAEEQLQQALALAEDPTTQAGLEGKLGDVAFRRGDQVAAREYVEGALRHLGRWVPRSKAGYLIGALWEILVQAGHTVAPRRMGRRRAGGSETVFLAARLYSRLAYIYWFSCGRAPCAWTHLRGLNLVERHPPSPELAQAYSEHAPVVTMLPWFRRGIAYARKSYEIRSTLGDDWGRGQSLGFYGVALYAASRYQDCIDACEGAVSLLSRMGDRWEENTALWHIAFSQYRLGRLHEAVETARRVHDRARAIGDQTSRGIALSVWSRASGGDVPAELLAAEMALGTEDAHKSVELRIAETVRLLNQGDWNRACEVIDEGLAIVKAAGLRQEYVAPAYAWAATALRARAASLPPMAGAERTEELRRARKAARRALVQARFYRNNQPHAQREMALVSAMSGRRRRARRLLASSIRVAVAQGAEHERSLSERALGELEVAAAGSSHRLGPPSWGSDALVGLATDRLADLRPGTEWNFSLADRFSTLLEVSHSISTASSPADVYQAVRDAAVRLLRGDGCHIVKLVPDLDAGSLETTDSGTPLDELSHGLIRLALDTGAPVIAGPSSATDSSESMVLSDARSSLCTPVMCEGRPVAVVYVESRRLAELFGEQEKQLASFISTLAGAALEHLAGSEARFRSLVQNSSDVITIVGGDGVILYQSEAVCTVFGLQPDALVGRPLSDWVHVDDGPVFSGHLGSPTPGPARPALVKCRVLDADGSWRHVETAVTDLRQDPGVQGVVLNTRDVSERVALEAELLHRAWHDVVTGLPNRALFTERVNRTADRFKRQGDPFAVLFLDLDDFKSINDTLGHATGDQVLQAVSERLSHCVRADDTVARFGGDEFAILLEGADADRATAVCERVLELLAEPIEVDGHQLEARASIGIVMSGLEDTSEGLLAAADAALYVAKARGKRRFETFEPAMRASAVARAGLRSEFEHALDRGELCLVYQPVVAVASGAVAGFEALLRWNRPGREPVEPSQFIPLAEESGAIVTIGAWVIRQACLQAREWRSLTGQPLTMAVNVSARQLLHGSLIDDVKAALADSDLPPSALVLEITESATVQETDAVMSRLHQLKALGLGLAIDDFGTGYSALSYLRRLPVDVIKIDRSFVSGLAANPGDVAIVQTVVSLSSALGLETIAEGVESLDQLEILTRLGCTHAQGYNWERPTTAEALTRWLVSEAPVVPDRPTVMIVDDSVGIRSTLRVAVELDGRFEVIAEATEGTEAVALASRLIPNLILLDLGMPGAGGDYVLDRLKQVSPASQVVILTAAEPADIPAAVVRSARAVLDKTRDLDSVMERLGEIAHLA